MPCCSYYVQQPDLAPKCQSEVGLIGLLPPSLRHLAFTLPPPAADMCIAPSSASWGGSIIGPAEPRAPPSLTLAPGSSAQVWDVVKPWSEKQAAAPRTSRIRLGSVDIKCDCSSQRWNRASACCPVCRSMQSAPRLPTMCLADASPPSVQVDAERAPPPYYVPCCCPPAQCAGRCIVHPPPYYVPCCCPPRPVCRSIQSTPFFPTMCPAVCCLPQPLSVKFSAPPPYYVPPPCHVCRST